MMRRITLTAVAALLVVVAALLVVPVTPALGHPSTTGCVTKAEFRQVTRGTRMARVHSIFDTRGWQSWYDSGPPASQSRTYKSCTHWWPGRHGRVYVDYTRSNGVWRLTSKMASW